MPGSVGVSEESREGLKREAGSAIARGLSLGGGALHDAFRAGNVIGFVSTSVT